MSNPEGGWLGDRIGGTEVFKEIFSDSDESVLNGRTWDEVDH